VWFYFDGEDVIVYSEPNAAKVRHVKAHSRVSLTSTPTATVAASSTSSPHAAHG